MGKKDLKKTVTAIVALAVAALLMYGAYKELLPKGAAGGKDIMVTVVHADAVVKKFQYHTKAAFLGEVLVSADLVEGDKSEYGLFITGVDGETADDGKQQWWCLTKGGGRVNTSADQTPIADGDTYELTLMEGY